MFNNKYRFINVLIPAILIMFTMISCGKSKKGKNKGSSGSKATVKLQGAGSTFAYPLYSKMFKEYGKDHNIQVNYQAIGSGGGIRQLMNKTVDFGASDAPLSDKAEKQAPDYVEHIPTCLGAVAVTYNLPGKPKLKMTPDILSGIFLGKIKKWNNQQIKAVNPNVKLPNTNITVVHRSDGSGTTYIFADYLSKVSSTWKSKVGRGKALDWPVGLGGKGNPGVAGLVKKTTGAIGYVGLIYALQNNMPFATLKNKSGNFITPDLKSVTKSANVKIPADARVSITNTDAPQGYPISGFTWLLIYKNLKTNMGSEQKARTLVNLVHWMLHKGQKYTKPLKYAPLPAKAQKVAENNLEAINYGGQPLLNSK